MNYISWQPLIFWIAQSSIADLIDLISMTARVETEVNWIDPTFFHYVADRGTDCFVHVTDGWGVKIAPPTASWLISSSVFDMCFL